MAATARFLYKMISEEQSFSRLDNASARFLSERTTFYSLKKQAFEAIVVLVSYEQNQGHSCIELDELGRELVLASGLAVSHSLTGYYKQTVTMPWLFSEIDCICIATGFMKTVWRCRLRR